jgi:hypothetical protein
MREEQVKEEQVVNTLQNKKMRRMAKVSEKKMVVTKTVKVPDTQEAARRLIRDFLNNKLTFFTRPN